MIFHLKSYNLLNHDRKPILYIFKFFYRKTDTKKVGEVSRYAPTRYDVTIEMWKQ